MSQIFRDSIQGVCVTFLCLATGEMGKNGGGRPGGFVKVSQRRQSNGNSSTFMPASVGIFHSRWKNNRSNVIVMFTYLIKFK